MGSIPAGGTKKDRVCPLSFSFSRLYANMRAFALLRKYAGFRAFTKNRPQARIKSASRTGKVRLALYLFLKAFMSNRINEQSVKTGDP